jgi:hypothetical protein
MDPCGIEITTHNTIWARSMDVVGRPSMLS